MTHNGLPGSLAAALRAVGQAHHEAFAHVDGHDPEWARWYAGRLLAEHAAQLPGTPAIERLAELLTEAARRHEGSDEPWPEHYAEFLRVELADG